MEQLLSGLASNRETTGAVGPGFQATLHVFTDTSLTGKSAVLVVYIISGDTHQHQLLMLDTVKAWELVFTDSADVNSWMEERYRRIRSALTVAIGRPIPEVVLAEAS